MASMDELLAWMNRTDVVLAVSLIAIVLSLAGLAVNLTQERRRG